MTTAKLNDLVSQFLNSDKDEKAMELSISEIFMLDRQIYERDLALRIFYRESGKEFIREKTGDYLRYGDNPIPILLKK